MKLVHSGDWHLSAQRGKIDPETGLNSRLMDFYRCARFTINDGLKRGAELILHAGDVFNSCRPSPTEVRLCREALAPALEAGMPVVLCLGNHDAPRSPTERHALDLLRDTPGVTVVDQPALLNVLWAEYSTPQDVVVQPPSHAIPTDFELVLQVAVAPWPNKQLLLADAEHRKLEPGQLNELVRDKMLAVIRGLAAQLIEGVPAILLGHFSVDVAEAGGMSRLMMLGGEWVLGLHDLTALPFSAILLAHVHKPQVLSSMPLAVYCGSPECVSHGEEAERKSYHLIDVEHGQPTKYEKVLTPHRRFVTVDLEGDDGLPPAAELTDAIVRVRIGAAADVDMAALRQELEAAGVHEYQISTERAEAVRRRDTDMSAGMDVGAALREWLKHHPDFEPLADELVAEAQAVETAIAGE